jgi:hypothetical protein
MMAAPNHEYQFVKSFFAPMYRSRWLGMVEATKGRRKFLEFLHHGSHALDDRFLQDVGDWDAVAIVHRLRQLGADSRCYLFSEWDQVDQKVLELEEAIVTLLGCQMGSVASCVPGVLGYWEGEEPHDRYICFRK